MKPLPLYDLEYYEDDMDLRLLNDSEHDINKNENIVEELIDYEEITDEYRKANLLYSKYIGYSYIKKHYRINYTFKECLLSLFCIHNETVNIWSHLISGFIAIGVFIWRNINPSRFLWISDMILLASIVIFFASTICHLFNPMSKTVKEHQILFFFDFLAIVVGIILFETTFFYLLLIKQITEFKVICIISCILNCIPILIRGCVAFRDKFISRNDILYGILIVCNMILILTAISITKSKFFLKPIVILPFIFTNLILIGSVVFNLISGYPEKHYKGQCILCGASHQIWHFIVSFYILSLFLQVENWEYLVNQ